MKFGTLGKFLEGSLVMRAMTGAVADRRYICCFLFESADFAARYGRGKAGENC